MQAMYGSDETTVRRAVLLAAVAAVLLPPADVVRAQAAPESAALEEVVVTARRREESLQQTPVAVSAFPAEEIRARSLTSLMDVGAFAPNVVMASGQSGSGGGMNGQIYIRGIGQADFLFTTDPGVGVYIDGVYLPRTLGANMDLLDIERIEILRGPQGTLFGKNTIGGAVNVVSAKPGGEWGGAVEVTTGRFDRLDVRASADVPILPGVLAGKVAFMTRNRDGYARRVDFNTRSEIGELGDDEQLGVRGALRWQARPEVTVDVAVDYSRMRQGSVPEQLLFVDDAGAFGGVPFALWNALIGVPSGTPMSSAFVSGDPDLTFGTGPNVNDLDVLGVSGTIEWDLGWATVKSITAYREMEARFGRDGDGSPLTYVHTDNRQDQDQVSEELHLFGQAFDGRVDWLAGFFYMDEFGRDRNDVRLASGLFDALEALPVQLNFAPCAPPFLAPGCPGNPINPLLDLDFDIFNEIDITSLALFGQATWDVTSRLSLTAGIRYSYEKKEYTLEHRRIHSDTFIVPLTTVEDSWTAATPMGSIAWRWTDDLMTYFTVSRGFKSGGFNGRPTTAAEVESFDPEFVLSYEVGMKSEWFGRRLRLNANGYFSDYEDLQFGAVSVDPATGTLRLVVDNAGAAEILGFELELQAVPGPNMVLTGAVGYTDFEITELDPGVTDATLDSEQVLTPEWTASGSLEYTLPWWRWGTLRVRGDVAYQSEAFLDIQNTPQLIRDAHVDLGARLTWALPAEGWELAVFGTNLLDERYLVNGAQALSSFGTVEGFYSRPREWGVTLRRRW